MLAPALDGDEPWWDYESWALNAASARSTVVRVGPRLRPARLAARRPRAAARARAAARRVLEGGEPRRVRRRRAGSSTRSDFEDPATPNDAEAIETGTQRIRVTIRNLAQPTTSSPPAGPTKSTRRPCARPRAATGPGRASRDAAARRRLRGERLHAADHGGAAPGGRAGDRRAPTSPRFRRLLLTGTGTTIGQTGAPLIEFPFPQFGDTTEPVEARTEGNPQAIPARFARARASRNGPVRAHVRARAGAGAPSPRRRRTTSRPCCATCATASSTARRRRASACNLDGFLFDAKAGYCQQFSGRDGAAAAHGRRARPRVDRLHLRLARRQDARVRGPRPRRPLVGRGLVPRHRLGHVRPDAGRRPAALAAERGR